MSCMLAMKSYPTLYVVDVDFAAAREALEPLELIEPDHEECFQLKSVYEQITKEEALAKNG